VEEVADKVSETLVPSLFLRFVLVMMPIFALNCCTISLFESRRWRDVFLSVLQERAECTEAGVAREKQGGPG